MQQPILPVQHTAILSMSKLEKIHIAGPGKVGRDCMDCRGIEEITTGTENGEAANAGVP